MPRVVISLKLWWKDLKLQLFKKVIEKVMILICLFQLEEVL